MATRAIARATAILVRAPSFRAISALSRRPPTPAVTQSPHLLAAHPAACSATEKNVAGSAAATRGTALLPSGAHACIRSYFHSASHARVAPRDEPLAGVISLRSGAARRITPIPSLERSLVVRALVAPPAVAQGRGGGTPGRLGVLQWGGGHGHAGERAIWRGAGGVRKSARRTIPSR
ncbi:hypothetical protein T484DRAFT_1911990 [Baffinella frigidus]|nr:hypothetical protein T484DRAFT_1911990 [Cryptophyta sp. CCMP2293]